jgi:hemerythrin-like domain-containing protein
MSLGWSIKRDHDLYRVLLSKMFKTTELDAVKRKFLFEEYEHNLYAHHDAEERVLFPAMVKKPQKEWRDLAYELEMEHRAMKILIKELSEMGYDSKVWTYRLSPLFSIMRVHWDKEEQFLIPFSLEYFTVEEWESLGKRFDDMVRGLLER